MPLTTNSTSLLEYPLAQLKLQYPEGLEVNLFDFNPLTSQFDISTRVLLNPPTDIFLCNGKTYRQDPRDPSSYYESRTTSAASIEDTLP